MSQASGFAGASNKELEDFCTKTLGAEDGTGNVKQIACHMMVVIDDRTLKDGTLRVSKYDVGFFFDEKTGESDDARGMVERWESLRCRWHELGWFLQLHEEDSLITSKACQIPPMKEDDVWMGDAEDDGESFVPGNMGSGRGVQPESQLIRRRCLLVALAKLQCSDEQKVAFPHLGRGRQSSSVGLGTAGSNDVDMREVSFARSTMLDVVLRRKQHSLDYSGDFNSRPEPFETSFNVKDAKTERIIRSTWDSADKDLDSLLDSV